MPGVFEDNTVASEAITGTGEASCWPWRGESPRRRNARFCQNRDTSVTGLDMDDLKGRAGKHSWGYVEPAEAAQELLQESIAGHLDDMERRLDLELEAAASVRRAAIFCRRMPTLLKSLSSGQDRKQPFKAKHHSDQTISSQAVHSQ
jgi:hypothetical protein